MDETGDMCNDGSTSMIIDAMTAPSPATGPITEDEIRAFLLQGKPVSTADLVLQFRSRLKSKEAKVAFAAVLKRICKIQKTRTGASYVLLREEGELLDTLIATEFFRLEI
ncbi:transcription initiation factor IIF subunit alpha-like isoform X1 [Lycium ferocissimum]|uniref:transcription initiation factor IIF subunit alpha-like isoform X1 n=2 Tax=Lycium ferocissimum TaxID=112874 RepID=UPI0028162213|nr:transcription initiation factor IIF subunit alpha-like isoform X1 [Lycium ferocissimum]